MLGLQANSVSIRVSDMILYCFFNTCDIGKLFYLPKGYMLFKGLFISRLIIY